MSYIVLQRESNNFKDILSDAVLKKSIRTKLMLSNHLILEFDTEKDTAYAILKYGDDIVPVSSIIPDRTPVMNVDYFPKKNDKKRG